ncbi:o-succinylbenzoate--CoA ligase [Calidifontibacter terrae]
MPQLRPFTVDPADPTSYLDALRGALEGRPVAPNGAGGEVPDGVALVIGTSGSTGTPKRAMLTAANLISSAQATHRRLGGPGRWLLPMPAQHIAGTQVLIRSLVAGTEPVSIHYSDEAFVAAAEQFEGERRYTSLVPTQLVRLLGAGHTWALRRFDAILLGGAACPPALRRRAEEAGVPITTTYGMSETAGGCVYDGQPLDNTTVELDDDGRITLRGPMVALGYLDDPDRSRAVFDGRAGFRTDDIGEWTGDRLSFLGRIDDLINTGGMKVSPRLVEEAATELPGIREAVAVGLPHPEWGETVGLAVVGATPSVEQLRTALRDSLPGYALPRRVLHLTQIPVRGPGKPDCRALISHDQWQD